MSDMDHGYEDTHDLVEDDPDAEELDDEQDMDEGHDHGFDDELEDDEEYVDANTIAVPVARNVLEFLVKSIVDNPAEVAVEMIEKQGNVTLEVTVAAGDMGRVIGRRGRVANSIRTVVRAAAAKDGSTIDVEFVD